MKKMCFGVVLALLCMAGAVAQVAKLPAAMASCVLENGSADDTFVKSPTIGLLMEGGFLNKDPSAEWKGAIKKCAVTGSKATYLISLSTEGTEVLSVQVEFTCDTFADSAAVSYVKILNRLNGQVTEQHAYNAYNKGTVLGMFLEIYRMVFDVDAVNKALAR